MAHNTVVAVFEDYSDAERAVTKLVDAGIDRDRVEIAGNTDTDSVATNASLPATRSTTRAHDEAGIVDRIGNFFNRLFGDDDRDGDISHYSEAVRRGGAVVSVRFDDEADADRAADILHVCGAVDIDQRAQQWRATGWTGTSAATGMEATRAAGRTDEHVIPVVDEELQVGKRRRDRGGVRIYTHRTEQPVTEQITLREEHAKVERRPADRPATAADLAAFKEGTIEIRETVEEPVVAKRAHVVEEVVVGKETTEHVETVNGVVRRGDVEVQNLDSQRSPDVGVGSGPRVDAYDGDFRTHWQSTYGQASGSYEDYQPAYRYGSTLAADERYRDRDWDEIEPDARRRWESDHPGSAWERMKAAVRHGRDRVMARH